MKKKILIALLAGTMIAAAPVSSFAAEATDAAEEVQESTSEDSRDTTEAEESKEEKATDDQKKEELKTVGEKKDGCITFKMKNATSKKITGLAIKTAKDTEFPENMMAAEDSFELKEKKKVFYSKAAEENTEETTDAAAEDQAPAYDLHITFEDETTTDVHGVALEDLGTLTIREKDGIVYGTYKTKSTKEKKSTYDTEKAIADQAAADAAAAEAASQQTESYDSNDYSYDYSDDYSYDYDDGGDSGDDGDGCLDNGLLN